MLVLSRRPEQSIAIGSNITVVVLGIKGNQVRLGFRARATWSSTGPKCSIASGSSPFWRS